MTVFLPLFYFKPTICWIDDDQIFLDAINLTFRKYNCITFNNPDNAIAFFSNYQSPLTGFFSVHNNLINTNISIIHDLSNFTDKSNEVAVLIVDYNMPKTNGLEICKKLKSFNFKIILLTGETTHDKAIEAFDLGLIDRFIKKDNNISDNLQICIDELIYQFFCEKTDKLISHIKALRLSFLSDQRFINFFNQWCHENKIEEFYLINKNGDFLVKDKNKNVSNFIVINEFDKNESIA